MRWIDNAKMIIDICNMTAFKTEIKYLFLSQYVSNKFRTNEYSYQVILQFCYHVREFNQILKFGQFFGRLSKKLLSQMIRETIKIQFILVFHEHFLCKKSKSQSIVSILCISKLKSFIQYETKIKRDYWSIWFDFLW